MLPQVNARITAINREGGTAASGYSEDYDRPPSDPDADAAAGKAVWTGQADAYLIEKRQRNVGQNRDLVKSRTLVIEPEIEVNEGDTLTWRRVRTGETDSGKILVIERPELPGHQPIARLTMEDVPG